MLALEAAMRSNALVTRHVHHIAEAVAAGAEEAGADVRVRRPPDPAPAGASTA
jgi:hypothetical protein